MDREDVIKGILAEREYQKKRWGLRNDDGTLTEVKRMPDEWAVLLRYQINKSVEMFAREPHVDLCLERIRNIAGLAVATLEQCTADTAEEILDIGNAIVPTPTICRYINRMSVLVGRAQTYAHLHDDPGVKPEFQSAFLDAVTNILLNAVDCLELCFCPARPEKIVINARDNEST